MAFCPTEEKYGYEDSRFDKDVDENFHCSICCNVLKEPVTCRNNDHIFCRVCITEHLKQNAQTCPECNDDLSVDTFRRPRLVIDYLSKLKINCDYASQRCPELTYLEQLPVHVKNCGYAPVLFSNPECGMVINKKDKVDHESKFCECREVKCYYCGRLAKSLSELNGKVENVGKAVKVLNVKMDKNATDINKAINEKVETEIVDVKEKVKEEVGEVKEEISEVKEQNEEVKEEIGEIKKDVKDIKKNISKVNNDVDGVKAMMTEVMERLNMLKLNKLPFPTEGRLNTPLENILIAGGAGTKKSKKTVGIFSWQMSCWVRVESMQQNHWEASSYVYRGQVNVVGGLHSTAIESLDLSAAPLRWKSLHVKLPYLCYGARTVVCQERVIHIGGYDLSHSQTSNVISELRSTSTCILTELCQMPDKRSYHCAEVFEGKVLILGGYIYESIGHTPTDSVLEFDPEENICKIMPKLPSPLVKMASVRWRDEVVMMGGRDNDNKVLNDVFMYNCKTGQTRILPSMLEERCSCCAVITGDTIVVLGGFDGYNYLNSVESFTMGSSAWKYLPPMNAAKYGAVAEVLPPTRKYV